MEFTARPLQNQAPRIRGARLVEGGAEFSVFSHHGDRIFVCLFDESGEREVARWRLGGRDRSIHHGFIPGVQSGARYGLRADGPYEPARGHLFDPMKLLVDPYAKRVDRRFRWRPELALPRNVGVDTAPFVPRGVIEAEAAMPFQGRVRRPEFIYEVNVKSFTARHPDVPIRARGTIAGLASPFVVEKLARLGVTHVELMPVAAAMTERHLADIGLENAWGYNSACFMALDPALAPGGVDDLRKIVDALRAADIGVILDVVFNHTAESDDYGPTLNLRGLDNAIYYRSQAGAPDALVNDTGCGNTLASHREPVVALICDTLRHFVERAGVDGFRFDLAATLARDDEGFPARHPLFDAIAADPQLSQRVLVAEPWDVGPGGYRLGSFGPDWLEWNDLYRDRVRKFWRGDPGAAGDFATALAGSHDVFGASRTAPSASVNFVAAHDGFTLRDLVSFARKHNEANGEGNRDGADENFSWNCGREGVSGDPRIEAARNRDIRAMLACLFVSRGTPMLTAGDEMGRTQQGNNNAYAQDNELTFIDWAGADVELGRFVEELAALRRGCAPLRENRFLTGAPRDGELWPDALWTNCDGSVRTAGDWVASESVCLTLTARADGADECERVFIAINRSQTPAPCTPPPPRAARTWTLALDSSAGLKNLGEDCASPGAGCCILPARAVLILRDRPVG